MYGAADEKSAWHTVGTCLVAWLLPSFSYRHAALLCDALNHKPPSPVHPQAAVFSLQTSLSWPLGCAEQIKQRLGWGRTKCGGAGEVTLLSPYPGMFGK